MATETVLAVDRIGNLLADQSMGVGGVSGTMFDEGTIPAFGGKNIGGPNFQDVIKGNVIFSQVNGTQMGAANGIKLQQSETPGKSLVDSIQSVRDCYLTIQDRINTQMVSGSKMTSASLLEMQFLVMQLAYVNELSSKVADKTSQGLQTLFRNQG
jgi:hypothetical protein